jgi:hypothetical protein
MRERRLQLVEQIFGTGGDLGAHELYPGGQ